MKRERKQPESERIIVETLLRANFDIEMVCLWRSRSSRGRLFHQGSSYCRQHERRKS